MSDCPFIPKVHLLHDGELSPRESARRGRTWTDVPHAPRSLRSCNRCRRHCPMYLPAQRLSMIEHARLDAQLESARNNQLASERDWLELAHTAHMLSTIAASILIISSIWLLEIPSRHTTAVSPAVVVVSARDSSRNAFLHNAAEMPAWERAALTLRVDPRPGDLHGGAFDVGVADARMFNENSTDGIVADWFVAGLQPAGAAHAYR